MVKIKKFAPLIFCAILASCDATIHFYPGDPGDNTLNHKMQSRINVDWSGYGKTQPTGMTVICHHTETGEKNHTVDNNIDYVSPHLSEGRHWATLFNLTEDEYSYIAFRGLDAAETAEAYLPKRQKSHRTTSRNDDNSYVASQPEWLAVDTIMTDPVDHLSEGIRTIGTLHPQNIIFTLHLTLHTTNIGNLKAARGVITGLANGRMLHSDTPNHNTTTVTHIIDSDSWSRSRTQTQPDLGYATASIRCFGLPGNHKSLPDENTLEFQAMLSNGEVLKYEIPVGHLIDKRYIPEGMRGDDLNLYLDLWLDPPLPPGDNDDDDIWGSGSWGLDVWVDDWDEQEDIDILL